MLAEKKIHSLSAVFSKPGQFACFRFYLWAHLQTPETNIKVGILNVRVLWYEAACPNSSSTGCHLPGGGYISISVTEPPCVSLGASGPGTLQKCFYSVKRITKIKLTGTSIPGLVYSWETNCANHCFLFFPHEWLPLKILSTFKSPAVCW